MAGPGASPRGLALDALVDGVRAALADLSTGARLGLAVSGGADSVGMGLLVGRARPDLALHVLHVRHGLREDAADAAAARALAERLGAPYHERRVQVLRSGQGLEGDARQARYAALLAMAHSARLEAIAVGHTAEDQAETVLLNIARGAGLRGVGGMRPVRAIGALTLRRPLLDLRRGDVRAVPELLEQSTVDDPTNADPDQRRRRAEVEVLPALARLAGGPGDPVAVLTRLAALARTDDDALDALARTHLAELVRVWGPVRVIDHAAFAALPLALRRRVLRAVVEAVRATPQGLSADAVEAALELDEGGEVVLPDDTIAERSQGWLTVAPGDVTPLRTRRVPESGSVVLRELALELRVGPPPTSDPAPDPASVASASASPVPPQRRPQTSDAHPHLQLADLPTGWVVRGRLPGETIELGGHVRAVREVLRDRGVPRPLRNLVPIVAASDGTAIWIPGIATSDVAHDQPARVRLTLAPAGSEALG
jgi:tRNA(Ile)-lysidine synthase